MWFLWDQSFVTLVNKIYVLWGEKGAYLYKGIWLNGNLINYIIVSSRTGLVSVVCILD